MRAPSRLTLRNANRHRLGPNRQPKIFATIYIEGMAQHKTCSHKMVQASFLLSRNRVGRNWNLGSRRVEKKDVPIELQKEMPKIITIVKKQSSDRFGEACCNCKIIISVISSKKGNHFSSRYFRRTVIFRGSLLLAFANICKIFSLLRRIATSRGRYFEIFTVMPVEATAMSFLYCI